jgi:hypothetical protein
MRCLQRGWRGRVSTLCLALSLLCALAGVPKVRAGVDGNSFTKDEWRKLDAGQLVLRPATRLKGGLRLIGGSSWQVIKASPSVVWRALLDTERYGRMMPQVLEAHLVRTRDNERTVFLRQGARGLVEASYYLKVHVHEPQRDITFAVDDHMPHDMLRAAWGFYTVRPYRDGMTLLAYGVMADIDGGPLFGLVRDNVHDWMLRTPWLVKKFVEGSGRQIYR